VTKRCARCGAEYQDWVRVCADCGIELASREGETEEDPESSASLSIEFTLLSGETVSVRAMLGGPATEEAVKSYAEELFRQLGTDDVRTFAYWWGGEFYVDAVRLREVAAISISTVAPEDDEEDWDE
jgi:hypothetical protein